MEIKIIKNQPLKIQDIEKLYTENKWSAINKPQQLIEGLNNSHTLLYAQKDNTVVGLANAISDGALVVYFPHLLVLPKFQKLGIGKMLMDEMSNIYHGFHMQMLVADHDAVDFYKKIGFKKAGNTTALWKYQGNEH